MELMNEIIEFLFIKYFTLALVASVIMISCFVFLFLWKEERSIVFDVTIIFVIFVCLIIVSISAFVIADINFNSELVAMRWLSRNIG